MRELHQAIALDYKSLPPKMRIGRGIEHQLLQVFYHAIIGTRIREYATDLSSKISRLPIPSSDGNVTAKTAVITLLAIATHCETLSVSYVGPYKNIANKAFLQRITKSRSRKSTRVRKARRNDENNPLVAQAIHEYFSGKILKGSVNISDIIASLRQTAANIGTPTGLQLDTTDGI
ncbi:MAG TPA: hypothetical protein EYO58_10270 [Flavobacteriales bacterium]|nr:hypothetical protein [Flavobacteriales bacterium]